jgi:hypothetical protein
VVAAKLLDPKVLAGKVRTVLPLLVEMPPDGMTPEKAAGLTKGILRKLKDREFVGLAFTSSVTTPTGVVVAF